MGGGGGGRAPPAGPTQQAKRNKKGRRQTGHAGGRQGSDNRKDPKSEMGKIKLKLPGSRKDPNTAAEVELPIDMPGMSPTLIEGLNRGVRLQARKNVRANSFKRDPQTGKLVPYEEWKAQQVQKEQQPDNVIEFSKAASSSPGFAGYSCIKARIDFVFCSGNTWNHASPSAARMPSR